MGSNCVVGPVLEVLAKGYYDLCQETSDGGKKKPFYGLRDFYSVIKSVKSKNFSTAQINRDIYRNFGGYRKVKIEKLQEIFKKHGLPDDLPPTDQELIEENLAGNNETSRHLMLLTKNLVALPLILEKLRSLNLNHQVIFGTMFQKDLDYFTISKNLRKIATAMLHGTVIVLIDSKNLYSPLYDVLNQHYKKRHGQNISRVAFGAETHEFIVDPRFRIIVIEDEDVVYTQYPPPLVNRFEKRLVTAKDHIALRKSYQKIVEYLEREFEPKKLACYHSDIIPSLAIQVVNSVMNAYSLNSEERDDDGKSREGKRSSMLPDLSPEDEQEAKKRAKDLYLKIAKPQEIFSRRKSNPALFEEYTSDYLFHTFDSLLDEILDNEIKRSICITTSPKLVQLSRANVTMVQLFSIEV